MLFRQLVRRKFVAVGVAEGKANRRFIVSEKKPEHPAVKIAGVIGGIVLVIVVMMAVLAKEHFPIVGWIVIPLAIMGAVLGGIASKSKD